AQTTYSWDHRNRLVMVIEADSAGTIQQTFRYGYDAFDQRIWKLVSDAIGSQTESYIYDGLRPERGNAGDHLLLRFDDAGNLSNRYVHGPAVDQVLADEQINPVTGGSNTIWPLTDNLGTVRDLADFDDVNGLTSVANHIVYDSFGKRVSESNAAIDHLFGYTGREWDEDVDLQYNRARWYDPEQGRFVSNDPIGFGGGDANLYRYVENETTMYVDSTGLQGHRGPNGKIIRGGGGAGGSRKPSAASSQPWYERQWWNPAAENAQLAVWWTELFSLDLQLQRDLNVAKQNMLHHAIIDNSDCVYGRQDGLRLGEAGRDAIYGVLEMPLKVGETNLAAANTALIAYSGGQVVRAGAIGAIRAVRVPWRYTPSNSGGTFVMGNVEKHGISGRLHNGTLTFEIKSSGSPYLPRGGEMFNQMLTAMGRNNVKSIQGAWWSQGEMSTNYLSYMKNLRTMCPEQAALKTPTGKWAVRNGFGTASTPRSVDYGSGTVKVVVEFTR
ncbi:MAG TPA: RHS repeat-associated core domain-containing protein, partial [Pirellulaceae bacterium]|nr:RHS repeat-associated core domain-containing protein [Pirellulaceae bacterium]